MIGIYGVRRVWATNHGVQTIQLTELEKVRGQLVIEKMNEAQRERQSVIAETNSLKVKTPITAADLDRTQSITWQLGLDVQTAVTAQSDYYKQLESAHGVKVPDEYGIDLDKSQLVKVLKPSEPAKPVTPAPPAPKK